ncbi:hypothetical protein [Escherichia coli]|nr:hypothetical protein [Escherichia coli]
MDFDAIMKKAYEEYFEGLAEGEEALSFSEPPRESWRLNFLRKR